MGLFRQEVVNHRRDRLHGAVNLAVPLSWQLVGGLFFVAVAAAAAFIALAGYSRIETVTGVIAPEGGVAQIVPSRPGVIANLTVRSGQVVEQGQPLAVVRTDESLPSGAASSERILETLDEQEAGLRGQEQLLSASAVADRSQLLARVQGLQAEIAGLEDRIAVQRGLVASARQELELAQSVAERGFISRSDILQREETWLGRQQVLTQLGQTLASQQAAIGEARAAIQQRNANAGAEIAALAAQRSDIAQRRTSAESSGAYRVEAPVAGIVTALTARVGQAVSPQSPIMSVVPSGTRLQAELYVPSSAIGFLKIGQPVALALDAFPYQRFGTTPATIVSIASAPIAQTDASGRPVAVYIVTAALSADVVRAYGRPQSILAGMTLAARITTERQSLFEWLFEPLFAVGRR